MAKTPKDAPEQLAAPPAVPAGQGGLTVVITGTSGGQNYSQAVYSATDAQRIFNAWQKMAGPRDPVSNQPNGTLPQFALALGQILQTQINGWIGANEFTPVTPPSWTVSNQ